MIVPLAASPKVNDTGKIARRVMQVLCGGLDFGDLSPQHLAKTPGRRSLTDRGEVLQSMLCRPVV
jgi:hypothetical protein